MLCRVRAAARVSHPSVGSGHGEHGGFAHALVRFFRRFLLLGLLWSIASLLWWVTTVTWGALTERQDLSCLLPGIFVPDACARGSPCRTPFHPAKIAGLSACVHQKLTRVR